MTYERALEIIQTEEYLTAADIDLIHKRADINLINKRKKRSMTSSSKDAKDKVTKTASTNLFFFSHVFFFISTRLNFLIDIKIEQNANVITNLKKNRYAGI